ncbi:hypothetical protein HGA88_05605 [Candidatus Roizmanbacteria bacterium]|nr:hypothetical protein [Candidatus Roizmanbacteria bacterium]
MEFKTLSWKELNDLALSLAERIEASGKSYDLIVAAARGGLTLSHILSDTLSLPITTCTIKSYTTVGVHTLPVVTYPVSETIQGKHVLFVDDLSDSGNTFLKGIEHLFSKKPASIGTAALFKKPWASFTPDFYIDTTEAWVIFPYDIRETIEALIKKLTAEGRTFEEIHSLLHSLGMEEAYLEQYLRKIG